MEDKHREVGDNNVDMEDINSTSEESFVDDLDDEDGSLALEQEDNLHVEAPLTEEEIEELIDELLEVESKAAEAQESLEKESLDNVEREVREELAQTLHGVDLEKAVADEMEIFREEWQSSLDDLETESAHLLEQLDGAGVDLPSVYKWIESQAPEGCCTEAWRKRTHWVGSQVANDAAESIADAEKQLQALRPVRRRHGKILEEGASGYLGKKFIADDNGEAVSKNNEVDWSSFNKLFSSQASEDSVSFGGKHWSSVYLASTPQQAAMIGIKFPGLDEVEEIDEIDGDCTDPFIADALANERELDLSEEQRRNYRKVKEEDDAIIDKKLQVHLKRQRCQKRSKQEAGLEGLSIGQLIKCSLEISADEKTGDIEVGLTGDKAGVPDDCGPSTDTLKEKIICNGDSSKLSEFMSLPMETQVSKCLREDTEANSAQTVILDSDDVADALKDNCGSLENQPVIQENGGHSVGDKVSATNLNENFRCTACDKLAIEVHQHPLLKVIVCKECKCAVEVNMRLKDPDCSVCYCGWCGRGGDLITCKSCDLLFCMQCIKRNIGEEFLSQIKLQGWQCCCCSPNLVQRLTLEFEKAFGSKDLTSSSSDTDSDNSDVTTSDVSISSRRRKKKIRRILDDAELGEETKKKIAIEKERQERLKSLQAQFSSKSMMMNAADCTWSLPEGAGSEVLGDVSAGYIVNVVREKGEDAIRIPPSISSKLKAHQVAGIRFMWENIIQSIRKVKAGDKGLGCILAHTMGLGKTFQVIAFLYTAMRSVDLGLKTALIVTPVNVLHNWRQEFIKWRPLEFKPLRVFMLEDVSRERRVELLVKWRTKGGIFLIGYTSFRNLSLGKNVKDRQTAREICSALQEGPDILICDEAHIIKNTRADTTQALKQVKCQRRIALTGSPLQNNLMEYYCMVDFVREGFLGSSHEFRNRFQNPIENGQHANSTADDVRIMNQRSHILYVQLKGFVQRMDMSVVKKDLPPKTVFVIAVKLSPLQRKLYKKFLDVHGFTTGKASYEGIRRCFFAGYQALAQIWNHPWILQLVREREYARRGEAFENVLADDSSSDENMDSNVIIGEKTKARNELMHRTNANGFLRQGWWNDLLNDDIHQEITYSGKMVLLMDILTMCSDVGDKALVFSQSLPTLCLIEYYLSKLPRKKKGKHWRQGKDWYRIDGKTEGSKRQKLVELFNDPRNRRVKCTLISTKAGALGINLYAANRVIIVDGSWNPTHDLQAIYRAWRYGQTKPVYAYRLMAHGTMEEKIYKRQVTKEGLAARVVDRQQVHRTMSKEEMLHLFDFGEEENLEALPELVPCNGDVTNPKLSGKVGNLLREKSDSSGSCSSDKLMEILLSRHYPRWVADYHEHETLLQENEEEKLTKEEQDMAWEVFRRSLEWEEVRRVAIDESTLDQRQTSSNAAAPAQDRSTSGSFLLPKPSSADPIALNNSTSPLPPPPQASGSISLPISSLRNRMPSRRCTDLSHLLTLKSQGTKVHCSTVCGECAQEISWDDLNRDSKSSR
ncbi:hypothetical protein Nepgr_001719 [Nepenthes gracilis]|uniref:ATP-dependent helicase ATRX n=1 Tax=Nepenthes gracilis TaxID=150966 RepID=A0AAD3P2Z6_NEPGR|nr:hypothetical protein Nepgr_001719 [Nepenthes gracilis]